MPLLLLAARVVLASAVFFLVPFVEGDMECGWFLLVAGRAWCRRVLVCSTWLRHGERLAPSGCYVANGCLRAPSSCRGCGRLCTYAAQVPAVLRRVLQGASASVHRQSGGFFSCFTETGFTVQTVQTGDSTVQFFAWVLTCPLCVSRQCRKTWTSRSCKY